MHAPPQPAVTPVPELGFELRAARALEHSATPTIRFDLAIESLAGHDVRSVLLHVQVQLAARRRGYDARAQDRLVDLFGTPDRWGSTLSTLPWLRTTVVVPPFSGSSALVALDVPCTYDLEVKASRYLNALEDATVPLELLFSGTVFYTGADGGLQTAMIGWDKEARFDMPVAVWRDTMDLHFPGVAWLRLDRGTYDRLNGYRSRAQHSSWEETLAALLDRCEESP